MMARGAAKAIGPSAGMRLARPSRRWRRWERVGPARAYAVNNAGTAAGLSRKYEAGFDKGIRPVRWNTATGAIEELSPGSTDNSGFSASDVNAINSTGTVVGHVSKYEAGVFKGI